ncbi:MAG TPA: extracellular solute-binding protein [Actinocrinis sp.]|uniref:extracellular solute-binding protein n=1 Tax=Actinocrinis sp. TaxID=1920516 RepID=UPI002DDCF9C1|nr:extracellular solute-binding protein [Actinocrinis sp.]HEV2345006.1 extracellular solute-binding protein [Actinocrinis sp.]
MRRIRTSGALVLTAALALTAAACSSSGGGTAGSTNTNGPVNLTWWHNGTTDPVRSLWAQAASTYHGSHPNVSFTVDPIQNEQFTTKVPAALEGDTPPDIYQQWGGGQLSSQITSGKLMDLTSLVSSWISEIGATAQGWQANGKQYGVPYDLHVVGFWYRKDLFAQAGITAPPATMDEFNADVTKLKAKNIVPVAIGSKDRWPDAFYWDYFAVRECSTDVLKTASASLKLDDPCWTKAGNDLKAFLATNPFQSGFLGTPAQQGAGSSAGMIANGKAAMELQGDWELSTMTGLVPNGDFKSQLGWFPFPAVTGAAGDPSVALGGGDGFSCTTKATAACADFLKYLASPEIQQKVASQGVGLPVNPAASSSLTDPTLQTVSSYAAKASYIQMYFDIAFPTNVGQSLDTAVANYFAGQGTPQSIVQSITNASAGGK